MASRYYDSTEAEARPGKISKDLREALNLSENEVPIWIYRMRALGYPPGWLKKAIVDTSDIFDTDKPSAESKKRKNPPEEVEETQYDHSKLIDYPGFNSPMPKDAHDFHYSLNMPAMLEHQQLEYAKKHMNAFKPVHIPKRQKTTDESIESSAIDIESPDSEDGTSSKSGLLNTTATSSTSVPDTIRLVSKGSPMPKPVTRAPLEKFSEGVVGDLLYFENLPQSTGKFDSIRGLLSTMRKSKSEANLDKTL